MSDMERAIGNSMLITQLRERISELEEVKRSHIRELVAANARIAELSADAERYRWLFDHDDGKTSRINSVWRNWDGQSDWRDAIDHAIASAKAEGDSNE